MNGPVRSIVATTILAISLQLAIPCLAADNSFTEDFSTLLYQDPVLTTANWDTGTGELGLFPFYPTLIGACDTPGYPDFVGIVYTSPAGRVSLKSSE